ncbi:hypothetical protein KC640_00930 [Candidatus Dojkabacteria bacterium]|uniref:Uncharacterized protein n=1 Tax=Candidatus Dojkabacteria bacterium TaxID=2099670 RepID=A0A955I948_9BACT|nr:hypothetical protein [Candidatus Dojkabacteria bacterium]
MTKPLTILSVVLFVIAATVFGLSFSNYQAQRSYFGGVYQGENYWLLPANAHVAGVYQTSTYSGFLQDFTVDDTGELDTIILNNDNQGSFAVEVPTYKQEGTNIYLTSGGDLEEGLIVDSFLNLLTPGNHFSLFITHQVGGDLKFLTGAFVIENL